MQLLELSAGNETLILECQETPTAEAILATLPLSSTAQTWGKEVYFPVPISVPLEETAREIVEAGEIAFWTEGDCVAIGFGPTPISRGKEIRLAARTNIWALSRDDVGCLASVKTGDPITLKRLDPD